MFVAALLPEEIKELINEYLGALKPACEGVKWERREKLHVTLKFLGDVDELQTGLVTAAIDKLLPAFSPFETNVTTLGGFPNLRNPRILYVGLSENRELEAFHEKIERELGSLGFVSERRKFTPHVTVGRIKSRLKLKNPLAMPERTSFEIDKIGVMKSELGKEGSVYTPLSLFNLGNKNS
ncbi:MAG: RNA 2',3'-cyclic phosphodiesterase [Deltaproteobacteria bacterium]